MIKTNDEVEKIINSWITSQNVRIKGTQHASTYFDIAIEFANYISNI